MGCCRSSSAANADDPSKKYGAGDEKIPLGKATKETAQVENSNFTDNMMFANNVPLFKRLPKDQFPLLAKAFEIQDFRPGQTIIKEGEEGHEFFCIKQGEATVMASHKKVATLKQGDYFGESSLLRDEPRSATVVAITSLQALKITREKFQELGLNEQLHFANRKAVAAEHEEGRQVATKEPSAKTDEERIDMEKALSSNENLKSLNLDSSMIKQIIDVAWREDVKSGQKLIEQGDMSADYFYIVKEGEFEILVNKTGTGDGKSVGVVTKGGSFGELALLYVVPRAATVKCKKTGVVWVIDRHNFKQILFKKSQEKVAEHAKLLDRVDLLAPLSREEKTKLARAFVEVHFKQDEMILRQGDSGNAFYVLVDGSVLVIKDDQEQARLEANASKQTAHIFGERALLNSDKRAATVKVCSATATAFALDREDFNLLLGSLKDIMAKEGGQQEEVKGSAPKMGKIKSNGKAKSKAKERTSGKSKVSAKETNANAPDAPREKILFEELKVLGLLGCGGFGAVELVEHTKTKESWALKAVSKGYIVQTGMKDSIMNEKMILTMTNSKFIVRLFETFNSSQNVYFLLELALGGELYATYNRKGFHGDERKARFYTAGVVFAFEHCHVRHVIYRDLKPENLLLTESGRIKLTDMGLAKFVVGITYTTCGTPDYFSPELIASEGHTVAVDWWTLGILVYELMSGNPPFESPQPMQTYSKVMAGIDKVAFPRGCKGVVEPLIKGLLRPEPADRLPMRPGGIKNIQDHEWYKDFDWIAMEKQTMEVPYTPVVKSKTDMKNFHARKEDMPPQVPYKDDGSGWDKDFATSV